MLSIGKITEANRSYHLEQVAQNAEEYYSGKGEAEGMWLGGGAEEFELAGVVGEEAFNAVLNGADPRNKAVLAPSFSQRKILGFDLTFSAPKSVSLMFVLGDPKVRDEVRSAHDTAVLEAMSYMEHVGAWGREGRGGKIKVEGEGFVSSSWRHRTSRAGDPQLHTHVVTANMVKTEHGRWVSLDSGRLYEHARTGGFLYQAALRRELTKRLGVGWERVVNGMADVKGFEQEALDQFSKRRAEVLAALEKNNGQSRAAGEIAAKTTRVAKKKVSQDSLYDKWGAEGAKVGITAETINELCGRSRVAEIATAELKTISHQLSKPTGMTLERATFDRRGVIQAVCEMAPPTAGVSHIERVSDAWIKDGAIPVIRPARADERAGAAQRVTRVVRAGETIFTTPAMAALEQRVVDSAMGRRDRGVGLVDPRVLDFGLTTGIGATLDDEQRDAVAHVLESGHGIDVLVGEAGTGKTYTLSAIKRIYENAGYRIAGAAVAARAAHELQEGAGIESGTLAAMLNELDRFGADALTRGRTVLVIDEAAMIGTRDLAKLLDYADRAQAKVVLVGDDGQLPSIDAGGVFRGLADRLGSARLTTNRRQVDEREREIVQMFREGRAAAALEECSSHGRLIVGHDAEETRRAMIATWREQPQATKVSMIAQRRSDVYQLNRLAQLARVAAGEIEGEGLTAGHYEYAVGDRVLCRRNDRTLHVINGDYGRVMSIDFEGDSLSIVKDDGEVVELPKWYIGDTESFQLGYAVTAHVAQGMTSDVNLVLGSDNLFREAGYTAMTRGRQSNTMFVTGAEFELPEAGYEPDREFEPLDSLRRALARSEAQMLAIDVGEAGLFAEVDMSELLTRAGALRGQVGRAPKVDHEMMDLLAGRRRAIESQIRSQRARIKEAEKLSTDPGVLFDDAELQRTIRDATAAIEELTGKRDAEAPREKDVNRQLAAERAWVAKNRGALDELQVITREVERRTAAVVRGFEAEPPAYLHSAIGALPESPLARTYWRKSAAAIEAYRQKYDVTDAQRALGERPRELEQLRERRLLEETIAAQSRQISSAPSRVLGRTL